jgi:hypothetical protein
MAQIRSVKSDRQKSRRLGNAKAKKTQIPAMVRSSHDRLKARLIAIV